ncbi:PAS domain S-box protein [Kovacikia minuta CCNUW1]|uniref:histidine kinase dimerization/phosphoacceptor domain -containing protein n=1 Tax=Kovacikia minuta TaxID=2931930 RepID=UPI001CCFF14B|nr:histidine kinase dimerization/phosphoacceptor domain -containing protein [Kovacikia minuta]UBF26478.1 PAS domain S-box protein [Kovacikia minuta CCNUW1]
MIAQNMAEGICLVGATDGTIVYANPKFEQMFGYNPGELVGRNVSVVNYQDEQIDPHEVARLLMQEILTRGEATYEILNVNKDGTPFWCRATTSLFGHPEYGNVLVGVHQDITERKQVEEKIQASLTEKEVLLKEIHHRVKNNLGIVSGLLQMQLRRTQDTQAAAILRDSQNRIASIALVHEKLYRSEDLANVDFAQYIADLTAYLFGSYNIRANQIRLYTQITEVGLDIERAVPFGLIINELISNALKHAFPGDRPGEIEVRLVQDTPDTLTLLVRDNGVGLPPDFDIQHTKTLGMSLIQGLAKQLRGAITIHSHLGTEFKISFRR